MLISFCPGPAEKALWDLSERRHPLYSRQIQNCAMAYIQFEKLLMDIHIYIKFIEVSKICINMHLLPNSRMPPYGCLARFPFKNKSYMKSVGFCR